MNRSALTRRWLALERAGWRFEVLHSSASKRVLFSGRKGKIGDGIVTAIPLLQADESGLLEAFERIDQRESTQSNLGAIA